MNKDLFDKIKKDIKQTGFVIELEIGEILRKNQFHTNHNASYEDKDCHLSREIDLTATECYRDKKTNLYVEYHLILEVKKNSDRPWIIFTNPPSYIGYGWRILHSSFNTTNKKNSILSSKLIDLDNPLILKNRIGKAYHELGKTSSDKSKIYESILSVCKAAYYFKDNVGEEPFKKDFDKNSSVEIHFYIPIIVIDGILVEVYLENNEPKIEEENWLVMEYEYASQNYLNASGETEKTFFPRVVRKDYLDEFILILKKWFNSCNKGLSEEVIKRRSK